MRNHDPRWQPGNFEKNTQAVARLGDLAAAKGITVTQLALAWLLSRGEHIVPIPGTRSARRVEENARAAGVTLTGADLATIGDILPDGGFGARYPERAMPTWT
jgi:aryl-alcohol dehydrogenase-like predicted oxidoreductase